MPARRSFDVRKFRFAVHRVYARQYHNNRRTIAMLTVVNAPHPTPKEYLDFLRMNARIQEQRATFWLLR